MVMWLFTDDLDYEFTGARACVEIEDDDLLPGSQRHFSVIERNCHRLSLQLTPQMTMRVVFAVIPHIVLPSAVGWDQTVPYCPVSSNAGLIYDQDGRSRVFDENREDSCMQLSTRQGMLYCLRNIVNVRISLHRDLERHTRDRHRFIPLGWTIDGAIAAPPERANILVPAQECDRTRLRRSFAAACPRPLCSAALRAEVFPNR